MDRSVGSNIDDDDDDQSLKSGAISSSGEVTHSDIDGFLARIGGFGRFQFCVESLLFIAMIPQTLQVLISYFVANNPPWKCVPGSTVCVFNGTIDVEHPLYKRRCHMARSDWEFSEAKDFSIATEFDLFCKTGIFIQLSTTIYFIGWAIGAVFLGWLADSYGRKLAIFLSLFGILSFGLASAFAPNIWTYLVLRFIVGIFQPGAGPQMSVFISEFVGPQHRPAASILLFFAYSIGLMVLGLKAYFIRKWRTLLIVCSAPYMFILTFAFYIPESMRWLHSQGRTEEAFRILKRIAKTNRKSFPHELELPPVLPSKSNGSNRSHMKVFITNRTLFVRTVIQSLAWFVTGLAYFGLSLAADDLAGGLYSDFMLSSVVEFPAAIAAIVCCNRLGRKYTVVFGLLIGSIACIAVPFIPININPTYSWLRVCCGMLGKFFTTISFDGIYTWSFELFATVIRGEGMGIMQVMSRFGAASAPWIAKWLEIINQGLPFYIMGGLSFVASLTMLWLPETKGQSTVETLDSSEDGGSIQYGPEKSPLLTDATSLVGEIEA